MGEGSAITKRRRTQVEKIRAKLEQRKDPFPDHLRPTAEECISVRDDLLNLYGFPPEFEKHRRLRRISGGESELSVTVGSCLKESVLDGLISILLSQNTTDANSQRAFASLKASFPSWEEVLAAESKSIEDAIRCGGLAPTKASCIKNILNCLLQKKGKLCMNYLRDMSVNEVKAELSSFKGIGPKTVACVLMFHLQKDDFPVDTHVLRISKAIGWVPPTADTYKAYLHLNSRIPDNLKFDLNCLIFSHGKTCATCSARGNPRKGDSCPLYKLWL